VPSKPSTREQTEKIIAFRLTKKVYKYNFERGSPKTRFLGIFHIQKFGAYFRKYAIIVPLRKSLQYRQEYQKRGKSSRNNYNGQLNKHKCLKTCFVCI